MSLTLSGSGTIGGLVAGGLPDATVTAADLAPNAVDTQSLTLFNASGSAPVYACRAWVNFNGTGTVAIRASGNVSSITDNGTGDYTVNFTTAMPDANYNVVGTAGGYLVSDAVRVLATNATGVYSTTAVGLIVVLNTGGGNDRSVVGVSIFR